MNRRHQTSVVGDTITIPQSPFCQFVGVTNGSFWTDLSAGATYGQVYPGGTVTAVASQPDTTTVARLEVRRNGFVSVFYYLGVPPTVPSAPRAPTVVVGVNAATVSVTASGDSTPAGYTVTAAPGGRTCTVQGAAGSCTIVGLEGVPYTFTAVAQTSAGVSTSSPPSEAVIPASTTPTNVTAKAGVSSIIASWALPTSTASIVGYTVYEGPFLNDCSTRAATQTSCSFTAEPGRSYTLTVVANLANGTSPAVSAPSAPAIPTLPVVGAFGPEQLGVSLSSKPTVPTRTATVTVSTPTGGLRAGSFNVSASQPGATRTAHSYSFTMPAHDRKVTFSWTATGVEAYSGDRISICTKRVSIMVRTKHGIAPHYRAKNAFESFAIGALGKSSMPVLLP